MAVPAAVETGVKDAAIVKKIIFACDAGMGPSAIGATKFRKRIVGVLPDIKVSNTFVDNIPTDCDIAVVQVTLVDRAKKSAPQAQIVTIGNFLSDPNLDALYEKLNKEESGGRNDMDGKGSESAGSVLSQAEETKTEPSRPRAQ